MEAILTIQEEKKTIFNQKFETVAAFEEFLQGEGVSDQNFEFYYGQVIEKEAMKQLEFFIVKFLTRLFLKTKAFENGGELLQEADIPIDEKRKRVADLAFFTEEQIKKTAKGEKVVPSFAIELLSESEHFQDIEDKIQDYFDAGVQTVWYVSLHSKRIYSYTSPDEVAIYKGKMKCNANPGLAEFEFFVENLFLID